MAEFSTEDRQLVDESARSFLSGTFGFDRWKQVIAGASDAADWAAMANMGWLALGLPEESGGSGGGMTELGILMAAAGHHMLAPDLTGTLVIGATAIARAGTQAQRDASFTGIASGRLRIAVCHTEPGAGFARDHVYTVAKQIDGGYRIEGDKGFAIASNAADQLLVSARLGTVDGPIGLLLVPRTAKGVHLNAAPAFDGRFGAAVRLDGVHVSVAARIGDTGDRTILIEELMDRAALATCAEACGIMTAATAMTVDYLRVREQFGQPLARFQVLQHRLVDMSLACEEARAIVHAALAAFDRNDGDAKRMAWQAKVQVGQSARFVGTQSLQLHGGIGMTDDLAIGHLYKRLVMCEAAFGDQDWHLSRLAQNTPSPASGAE